MKDGMRIKEVVEVDQMSKRTSLLRLLSMGELQKRLENKERSAKDVDMLYHLC